MADRGITKKKKKNWKKQWGLAPDHDINNISEKKMNWEIHKADSWNITKLIKTIMITIT